MMELSKRPPDTLVVQPTNRAAIERALDGLESSPDIHAQPDLFVRAAIVLVREQLARSFTVTLTDDAVWSKADTLDPGTTDCASARDAARATVVDAMERALAF